MSNVGDTGLVDNKSVVFEDVFKEYCKGITHLKIAVGYFHASGFDLVKDAIKSSYEDSKKSLKIQVIMGDATDPYTAEQIISGHKERIEKSIHRDLDNLDENNKGKIQSLEQLRDYIENNIITIKVYEKSKFHAKAYLFESTTNKRNNAAIVGSSNFSINGMTDNGNIELNVIQRNLQEFDTLKKWYKSIWREADDFSEDMLNIIKTSQPYIRKIGDDKDGRYLSPIELFLIMIYELLDRSIEKKDSDDILAEFQKIGYINALEKIKKFKGCIISDSVGLGKTMIGAKLIENAQRRGKCVLLLVPKNVKNNWENEMNKFDIDLTRLHIMTITELSRYDLTNHSSRKKLDGIKKDCNFIIVDEAHRLRNRGLYENGKYDSNKNYANLKHLHKKKNEYALLTATPLNNSVSDLHNLLNIFLNQIILKNGNPKLNINNFTEYSKIQKKILEGQENKNAVDDKNKDDDANDNKDDDLNDLEKQRDQYLSGIRKILEDVMVLRTRTEISKKYPNLTIAGKHISFVLPQVIPTQYVLPDSYNPVYLNMDERLSNLHVPHIRLNSSNGGKNIMGLFIVLLYKRLESSIHAFSVSIDRLYYKEQEFLNSIEKSGLVKAWTNNKGIDEELDGDTDLELSELVSKYGGNKDLLNMDEASIKSEIRQDLGIIRDFQTSINTLRKKDKYEYDDPKIEKLKEIIKSNTGEKILVFSQYFETIKYLYKNLVNDNEIKKLKIDCIVGGNEEIGSRLKVSQKIKLFAPLANNHKLGKNEREIKILLATDSIAEGVNLQDCSMVVNYDLPWNPMKIVQRVGRVDRIGNNNLVRVFNIFPDGRIDTFINLIEKLQTKISRITTIIGKENYILSEEDEKIDPKSFGEKIQEMQNTDTFETFERIGQNLLLKNLTNNDIHVLNNMRLHSFMQSQPRPSYKKYEYDDEMYSIVKTKNIRGIFAMFRIYDKRFNDKIRNITIRYDWQTNTFEEVDDIYKLRLHEFPSGISKKCSEEPPDLNELVNTVKGHFEKEYYTKEKNSHRPVERDEAEVSNNINHVHGYLETVLIKIINQDDIPLGSDYKTWNSIRQRAKNLKEKFDDSDIDDDLAGKFALEHIESGAGIDQIQSTMSMWDGEKQVNELEKFFENHVEQSVNYTRSRRSDDIRYKMICWGAFV